MPAFNFRGHIQISEITPTRTMLSDLMLESDSVTFARYLDLSCEENFISQHSFEEMAMHEGLPLMCETLCCMNAQYLNNSNQSLRCESLDLSRSRERKTVNAEGSKLTAKTDSYEHENLGQHVNRNFLQRFHSLENTCQPGFEELC